MLRQLLLQHEHRVAKRPASRFSPRAIRIGVPAPLACMWQSATAKASAASDGSGNSFICNRARTIDLHLSLVRLTVAGHAGFHFARGITVTCTPNCSAASSTTPRTSARRNAVLIFSAVKHGFHGHHAGLEFFQKPAQQGVHIVQCCAGGLFLSFGRNALRAITQHAMRSPVAFDNAVACRPRRGGVNAEHTQPAILQRQFANTQSSSVVYGEALTPSNKL